ncbi:MAG TPA: hypothetical protein VFZ61_24670 [Polyangiales bacterium]
MATSQPAPALFTAGQVHIDRDHVVATWRNVFICVWRHQTEEQAVRNLKPVIEALKAAHPRGIAMVTVVEPDADLPTPGARQALPKLFKEVAKGVACSALVFEGEGFRAAAVRALTTTFNMLAAQPFPHRVFPTVDAAEAMLMALLPSSAQGERLERGQLEQAVGGFRARLDAFG